MAAKNIKNCGVCQLRGDPRPQALSRAPAAPDADQQAAQEVQNLEEEEEDALWQFDDGG